MAWLDITNDLSAVGRRELSVGKILIWDYEGSPIYMKIMRKKTGKVWAKRLDPAKFLTPEQADETVIVEQKCK